MSIVQIQPSIHIGDVVRKFGYNGDVDASGTGPEDIIAAGDDQYWPSAAVAAADIDIVSSEAADDGAPAGTGARTLTILGLDSDYLMQSETVTLNGTTDVHPTKAYLRIFRAYVATAGSGGVNAGNIQIDDGAGNVLAYIPTGRGQTLQAAYTIPADYKAAWLLQYNAELQSKTAAYAECTLEVRPFGGAWLTKEMFEVSDKVAFRHPFIMPIKIAAKSDIRLRVIDASADNLPISGGFELYLER